MLIKKKIIILTSDLGGGGTATTFITVYPYGVNSRQYTLEPDQYCHRVSLENENVHWRNSSQFRRREHLLLASAFRRSVSAIRWADYECGRNKRILGDRTTLPESCNSHRYLSVNYSAALWHAQVLEHVSLSPGRWHHPGLWALGRQGVVRLNEVTCHRVRGESLVGVQRFSTP